MKHSNGYSRCLIAGYYHDLQQTIQASYISILKHYRFDLFANTVYEFIWNEFCDWYLELSKPILYSQDSIPERKNRGTRKHLSMF